MLISSHISRRFISLFLLILLIVVTLSPALAQSTTTQLAHLGIELWPDYDRPAMLVLLTGTLPAGTTVPAEVTIPMPEGAELHAVASFNEAGALLSNVAYSVEDGRMTLSTPSERFRVEYYVPYEVDGDAYSYTLNWVSDLNIDAMAVVVQQPIAATNFTVNPAPVSAAAERGDGLNYHSLATRPVSAGEPYTVQVSYTADAPVLSAPAQEPAAIESAAGTSTTSSSFDPLWLLVGAGVLGLVGVAWYVGQRQGQATAGRPRKPQPARPEKSKSARGKQGGANPATKAAAARFCHNCGRRAETGDAFCRDCGTKLKTD